MISPSARLDHDIGAVLSVVERRTIAFLRDEMGFVANRVDRRILKDECLALRAMTAIVGLGSRTGLHIAYSYDTGLIVAMTKRYTEGLSIGPGEQDLYTRETALDVVNVIVGNSTADLARRGELITLSPPVLMDGARTIKGRPDTTTGVLTLSFPEGSLDVAFVGPRLLFDDQLNYRGGHS